MSAEALRKRAAAFVTAGLASLLLAGAASAAPITVFFNGPDGFGVSEQDALLANQAGVQIVDPGFVAPSTDILQVTYQDLLEETVNPVPPVSDWNTATSVWQVQNIAEFDLMGEVYFLFVTTDPFDNGLVVVEYDAADVGLTIDPALGWVLVKASDGQQDYYYPSLKLGSLDSGENSAFFNVNYVLTVPIDTEAENNYRLPALRNGMSFEPLVIPEPATAALLSIGLIGLGFGGRVRR